MRIKETKAYAFAELSEEAKDKAIEALRDVNIFEDWHEFVLDSFKEKAINKGFEVTNVYFSGFYSQGDGAMFEYDGLDNILLQQAVNSLKLPEWKKAVLRNGYIRGEGKQRGLYLHEYSCIHNIHIETDNGMQYYDNIEDLFYDWHSDIDDYIIQIYIDLAQDLYRDLEREHEYLVSDSLVIDAIEANDFEFDENGEMI